jgi:fluoroacetyl-CoA thioesterase
MSKPTEHVYVGMRHSVELCVDARLTVPALAEAFTGFRNMPPVFATAFMVGFIEWAAIEALRDHLPPGQKTVGTHIDVSHVSATPIGMTVKAEAELVAVNGRTLRFQVRCHDGAGLIGEGFHERIVVDEAKFMKRMAAKAGTGHV